MKGPARGFPAALGPRLTCMQNNNNGEKNALSVHERKKDRRAGGQGSVRQARCSEGCREKENIALVLPAINSSGLNV